MVEQIKPMFRQSQKPQDQQSESNEQLKMPTILLMYRDNDLFSVTIPEVADMLRSMGRQVEIRTFSREMQRKELQNSVDDERGSLTGKVILTDRTLSLASYNTLERAGVAEDHQEYLDSLFQETVGRSILGDEYAAVENRTSPDSLEATQNAVSAIVERILENKDHLPDAVFVSNDRIRDHAPLGKNAFNSASDAALEVAKWLEAGGIAPNTIGVEGEFGRWSLNTVESARERPLVWHIQDRHGHSSVGPRTVDQSRSTVRHFGLPLANFFFNAMANGLLNIKPEEMDAYREELRKRLEADFGHK